MFEARLQQGSLLKKVRSWDQQTSSPFVSSAPSKAVIEHGCIPLEEITKSIWANVCRWLRPLRTWLMMLTSTATALVSAFRPWIPVMYLLFLWLFDRMASITTAAIEMFPWVGSRAFISFVLSFPASMFSTRVFKSWENAPVDPLIDWLSNCRYETGKLVQNSQMRW